MHCVPMQWLTVLWHPALQWCLQHRGKTRSEYWSRCESGKTYEWCNTGSWQCRGRLKYGKIHSKIVLRPFAINLANTAKSALKVLRVAPVNWDISIISIKIFRNKQDNRWDDKQSWTTFTVHFKTCFTWSDFTRNQRHLTEKKKRDVAQHQKRLEWT